jgi:uridylate kinase
MDTSAFVLANDHRLTMHVFDVDATAVMASICTGEEIGTLVTA